MSTNTSVGIIGNGFVGGAVCEGFKQYADVKVYDKQKKKRTHSFTEAVTCDFVFICLPTPMLSLEDGKCDLTIIESVFKEVNTIKGTGSFIIKSTVPVGTTQYFKTKYPHLRILHSPEFLTARTAITDFITPTRHIIGYPQTGETCHEEKALAHNFADFLTKRFPGVKSHLMTSAQSEMVKYIQNCFFATKVMFFNEMKLLAEKLSLAWEPMIEALLTDGRISVSHFQVPGHDGDWGFGGTCFPKDINSLISIMKENEIDPLLLEAVWKQNLNVRKNKDWEKSPSAVNLSPRQ